MGCTMHVNVSQMPEKSAQVIGSRLMLAGVVTLQEAMLCVHLIRELRWSYVTVEEM